jgi:hypothetical protein
MAPQVEDTEFLPGKLRQVGDELRSTSGLYLITIYTLSTRLYPMPQIDIVGSPVTIFANNLSFGYFNYLWIHGSPRLIITRGSRLCMAILVSPRQS